MKTVKRLMIGAFALLLLVPLAAFQREPGIASEIDNRMLQEFPFSREQLAKGGDLTAKTEAYISDRIGFRDQMILGYTQLNDTLFGEMVHPGYCWGKEGYVFGKPDVSQTGEAHYTAFANMVRAIQDYCEARSIPFLFVFEPRKESVLPEYLPAGVRYDRRNTEYLLSLLEEMDVRYLDMTVLLRELTEDGEVVFNRQFDAGHFNNLGAYYVVNAIVEELKTDFPGLQLMRLEDLEVSETLKESLPISQFPIHEWVPSIDPPERPQTAVVTPELRAELELHRTFRDAGGWRDPERLAQGAPRTLVFQGSHMGSYGWKFMQYVLGEYDYIYNYQNITNFDYYFNIFQPECVIFEAAENTLRYFGYFDQENMEAFRLNPALDAVLAQAGGLLQAEEPESLPLEGVSAERGEALTKLFWTGEPEWTEGSPYVWAVLDGTPYDMRPSARGGWEVTVTNENWDRAGGAVEIVVLDGETVTLLAEEVLPQMAQNVIYDEGSLTYTVRGKEYANLFEYGESPNGRYSVYVASQLGEDPEAWLYDSETDEHRQLTDNLYLFEHDVHVDNEGNWAAVVSRSYSVIYNGETVTEDGPKYRSLCFVDGGLFFAALDASARTSSLYLYDTGRGEVSVIASDLPLATGECAAYGENAVLFETYNYETETSAVWEARLEDGAWRLGPVTDGDGNSFLRIVPEGVRVEQVTGDDNAMYLFNAYYWLERYQNGEPWSGATDSFGRLSWNETYRLRGMLKLLEKTGDETLKADIAGAVRRMISTREAAYGESGRDTDRFLYPSIHYSVDKESKLTLMVNNGMIYWAMLLAANAGCLPEEDCRAVISMAEAAFEYYEEDWDTENGFYRYRKGTPTKTDGINQPFGQQNLFGLCLIELWKATGEAKYRERCFALAESFAREIDIAENGQAIWHYELQRYYDGWSEADGLSVNTPAKAPVADPPYEDASHGGMNAMFIFSFAETFADAVFQQELLQGVRQTAEGICTAEGLSDTIYPLNRDAIYFNSDWMMWMQEDQGSSAVARYAAITNHFETKEHDAQGPTYTCAILTDPAAGGVLHISSTLFSGDVPQSPEKFDVVYANIPEYAETLSPLWLI